MRAGTRVFETRTGPKGFGLARVTLHVAHCGSSPASRPQRRFLALKVGFSLIMRSRPAGSRTVAVSESASFPFFLRRLVSSDGSATLKLCDPPPAIESCFVASVTVWRLEIVTLNLSLVAIESDPLTRKAFAFLTPRGAATRGLNHALAQT